MNELYEILLKAKVDPDSISEIEKSIEQIGKSLKPINLKIDTETKDINKFHKEIEDNAKKTSDILGKEATKQIDMFEAIENQKADLAKKRQAEEEARQQERMAREQEIVDFQVQQLRRLSKIYQDNYNNIEQSPKLKKQIEDYKQSLRSISPDSGNFTNDMKQAKLALDQLEASIHSNVTSLGKLKGGFEKNVSLWQQDKLLDLEKLQRTHGDFIDNAKYDNLVNKIQSLSQETPNASVAIRELNDEIRVFIKETKHAGDSSKELENQMKELGKLERYQRDFLSQIKNFENSSNFEFADKSALDKLKQDILDLNQSTPMLDEKMKNLKTTFREVKADAKESADGSTTLVNQLTKSLSKASLELFAVRKGMQMIRNKFNEGRQYVKEMDSSLTEIAMVTNKTKDSVMHLAPEFNKMAKEMGMTTTEIARGAVTFYRQGLKQEEVMERLRYSAMYSKVANLDFAQSTEIITATMNSMGIEAERVVDVLLYLGDATATSGEEVGKGFAKTSGTARALGLEYEKVASWIAVISSKTREAAETIGVSINTILSRMADIKEKGFAKDGTSINQVATALDEVLNIELMRGNEWRDFGEILDEIGEKWHTLNDREKAYIATMMAGTRQKPRFLNLMESYSESLELYEGALNSAGTATRKFDTYLESREAKIARLKANWEEFYNLFLDTKSVSIVISTLSLLPKLLSGVGKGIQGVFGAFSGATKFSPNALLEYKYELEKGFIDFDDLIGELDEKTKQALDKINNARQSIHSALSKNKLENDGIVTKDLIRTIRTSFNEIDEVFREGASKNLKLYNDLLYELSETNPFNRGFDFIEHDKLSEAIEEYYNIQEQKHNEGMDRVNEIINNRLVAGEELTAFDFNQIEYELDRLYENAIDQIDSSEHRIFMIKERYARDGTTLTVEETRRAVEEIRTAREEGMADIEADYEHMVSMLRRLFNEGLIDEEDYQAGLEDAHRWRKHHIYKLEEDLGEVEQLVERYGHIEGRVSETTIRIADAIFDTLGIPEEVREKFLVFIATAAEEYFEGGVSLGEALKAGYKAATTDFNPAVAPDMGAKGERLGLAFVQGVSAGISQGDESLKQAIDRMSLNMKTELRGTMLPSATDMVEIFKTSIDTNALEGQGKQAGSSIKKGLANELKRGNFTKEGKKQSESFGKGIEQGKPDVKEKSKSVRKGAETSLKRKSGARAAGSYLAQGFIDGMESKRGSIVAKAASLASAADSAMRTELKIFSPSRKGMEIGAWLMKGFAVGIDRENSPIEKARHQAKKTIEELNSASDKYVARAKRRKANMNKIKSDNIQSIKDEIQYMDKAHAIIDQRVRQQRAETQRKREEAMRKQAESKDGGEYTETLAEIDRYERINIMLAENNNLMERNKLLQDSVRTNMSERIYLQEEEMALLEEKQHIIHLQAEEMRREMEWLEEYLSSEGFQFDGEGDQRKIQNLEHIEGKYNEVAEAFNRYVQLQSSALPQLSNQWYQLQNAINSISFSMYNKAYDMVRKVVMMEKKLSYADLEHRKTTSTSNLQNVSDDIDKEIDGIQDKIDDIDDKIKNIRDGEKRRRENKQRAEKQKEIRELQNKYNMLISGKLEDITDEEAKQLGLEREKAKIKQHQLKLEERRNKIAKLTNEIENVKRNKNIKQLKKLEDGSYGFEFVADERRIKQLKDQINDLQKDLVDDQEKFDKDIEDLKEKTLEELRKKQESYYEWERQKQVEKQIENLQAQKKEHQDRINELKKALSERQQAMNDAYAVERSNLDKHYSDIDMLTELKLAELYERFQGDWGAIEEYLISSFANISSEYLELMNIMNQKQPMPENLEDWIKPDKNYQDFTGSNHLGFGDGSDGTKFTDMKRLKTDMDYLYSEIRRTQQVISNRKKAGLDTKIQEKYLRMLMTGSFANGGKITQTGLMVAEVHGEKNSPEWIFNDRQLKTLMTSVAKNNDNSSTIEKLEVNPVFPNVTNAEEITKALINLPNAIKQSGYY